MKLQLTHFQIKQLEKDINCRANIAVVNLSHRASRTEGHGLGGPQTALSPITQMEREMRNSLWLCSLLAPSGAEMVASQVSSHLFLSLTHTHTHTPPSGHGQWPTWQPAPALHRAGAFSQAWSGHSHHDHTT